MRLCCRAGGILRTGGISHGERQMFPQDGVDDLSLILSLESLGAHR